MADNFFDDEDIVEGPSSFFDEADVVEDSEEEANEDSEMGAGEAALTGFGEGASFGLAPVLSGAVSVAGELAGDIADLTGLTTEAKLEAQGFKNVDDKPGLKGLIDAYYEGREGQKRQQETAFDDQPIAALAGNVAGGMASLPGVGSLAGAASKGSSIAKIAGKMLPKAESLKGLSSARKAGITAREGLKAGGLAGFGSGEAKLIDEDKSLLEGISGVTKETAGTALGGALLGGGLSSAVSGAGKLIKAIPGSKALGLGRELGKEGLDLTEESLKKEVEKLAQEIRTKTGKIFKSAGMDKADALEYADEIGIRVNSGEEISEVVDDLIRKGATSIEDQAEKAKFVRAMKGLQGEISPEIEAAKKLKIKQSKQDFKLEDKGMVPVAQEDLIKPIDEGALIKKSTTYASPEGDYSSKSIVEMIKDPEILLKKFNLKETSLTEVDQIINEVNRHTGDLTGPAKSEVEKKARRLAGSLRDLSNQAVEGSGDLAESNLKLSRIFSAMERGGVKGNLLTESRIQKDKQIDKLRKLIQSGGDSSEMDRERFFQYLNEAAPDSFGKIEGRADLLKKGLDLQQRMETSKSFNLKGLLGSAESLLAKGAHTMGSTERAITQSPAKARAVLQKSLYKITPDEVKELSTKLADKFGEKAINFSGPLNRAANSEGSTRNAIMYGLYQQPAFRKMLGSLGEDIIGDDDSNEE